MKILILGAGQVGSTVAESLVSEANDITVVDSDGDKLRQLQDRLDLRTLTGNAAHPSVLEQAGIADADMLLAVTQSDEVNLVACKLAATLYNTPTRIARIRAADYLERPEVFSTDNFCVDFSICPEQILTEYIVKLIEFPEALQVQRFSQGKASLVAVRAFEGGPLVGKPLSFLRSHMPQIETRVAAIFRKDGPLIPEGSTVIEDGDEIFFIAATGNIRSVLSEMRRMDKPTKRVMIVGGGNIGRRLAKALERDYQVKLIEYNKKSCEKLAGELANTLVLNGDGTDEKLMQQEHVDEVDVFCALTNDDENNIMSSLLAKQGGARKVIALINRSAYVDLLQGGKIDIALSPAQVTIGSLLAYVRQGDVVAVHSLRRGAAEALELVAHGDRQSSRVVGRRIDEIDLPKGATIGAIVRGDQVIMGHHDTLIEAEDHVIVFVINKRMVKKVERLFQVGLGFF
ncbi:MAG: Trk system potassium transport protein TrkA [Gallionellales bacterium RBG_16_57_15]|nr:MAG: Trk system potassium transport protein TrkA [Gallionellales bacterium RBG_16_57_15]OGT04683.1 MAG: Trk system potassium transport protein TrkA [Gallionellales bacterium RIFCSPLOWO2_02_60_31]